MVTYGNSSKTFMQLPASLFINKGITLTGFNMVNWLQNHSTVERDAMVKEVSDLVEAKKLRFWLETHRFSDWEKALDRASRMRLNRKVVMHMEK